MEIILVSKRRGNQARIRFGATFTVVLAAAGLLLVGAGGFAGYKFAAAQGSEFAEARLSEYDHRLAELGSAEFSEWLRGLFEHGIPPPTEFGLRGSR